MIESRGRHGTFVVGPGRGAAPDPRRLEDVARAFAVAVHQLGADHMQALDAVRRALGDLRVVTR